MYVTYIYRQSILKLYLMISLIFFEELETGIEKYASLGKLFLTGDLNSRCSDKNDLLSFDPYIDVDNQLSDSVFVLPRASMDHVIDTRANGPFRNCQS